MLRRCVTWLLQSAVATSCRRGAHRARAHPEWSVAMGSDDKEVPRITQPIKLVRKLERTRFIQARLRHRREVEKAVADGYPPPPRPYIAVADDPWSVLEQQEQTRKKRRMLISCKNKRKNHYEGQLYSNWSQMCLASCSWKRRSRSAGDYFTINGGSTLSAWQPSEDGPLPQDFSETALRHEVVRALNDSLDVEKPTSVQVSSIDPILGGWNTLLAAETGCGKTLAYLLPLVDNLLHYREQEEKYNLSNNPKEKEELEHHPDLRKPATKLLLTAPTQELCSQIAEVVTDLCAPLGLSVQLLSGKSSRTRDLRDIVVGTPASALTCDRKGFCGLVLQRLRAVVVDEADTLLDDSFCQQTHLLLRRAQVQSTAPLANRLTDGAQLVLASATMPSTLDELVGTSSGVNESLHVVCSDHLHRLSSHVSHRFLRSQADQRFQQLLNILRRHRRRGHVVIVFCTRLKTAMFLHYALRKRQVDHVTLVGRQSSQERAEQLRQFHEGSKKLLVTTDLGSRGLDTTAATHVINYEMPSFLSDYLHRAGRVGRVGSSTQGNVLSLVCYKWEVDLVMQIETSVRREAALPGVNANIRRVLQERAEFKRAQELAQEIENQQAIQEY